MRRNLLFLLFVTTIPFLTQLISQYGNIGAAVMIYDGCQLAGGLALASVWTHASNHHLLASRSLTDQQIRSIQYRNYAASIAFLIALIVAALLSFSYQYVGISPGFANLALVAIVPLLRGISQKGKASGQA